MRIVKQEKKTSSKEVLGLHTHIYVNTVTLSNTFGQYFFANIV